MPIAFLLALALASIALVLRVGGVDLRSDRGAVGEGGSDGGDGGEGGSGDAGGDTGGGDAGDGDEGDTGDGDAAAKGDTKVEMTQAELDELVAKRVAKATKAAKDEAAAAAEKAKLDENERTKLEAKEAEDKAAAREHAADLKLVRADAKSYALAAGADPKQVDAVVKLADLEEIEVEDDKPDEKAIKAAIDKVLRTTPALKAAAGNGNGASGGEHNGGDTTEKPTTLAEAVNRKLAGAGAK